MTDPLLGRELDGRYRIDREIGRGGMGVVCAAFQRAMDRTVAVKVLKPNLLDHPDQVRRFRQEARSASRLVHPRIVSLYDFGQTDDGLVYIVMEMLEGESLRRMLRRDGALAPERALSIASQIADGLCAAHRLGVVHRDLKPENIFLSVAGARDDSVKILDFGVAKLTSVPTAHATQGGGAVGTPMYMSPEQVLGRPVDGRSDLYALGLLLVEMLTGRLPFSGESVGEIMVKRLNEDPEKLATVNPALAVLPDVQRLVDQCVARDPNGRFSSAHQALSLLDAAKRDARRLAEKRISAIVGDTLGETEQSVPPDEITADLPQPEPAAFTSESSGVSGAKPLGVERVLSVLSRARDLPTLPQVAHRIMDAVSDETVHQQQVASLLAKDTSIAAKVLHLANSSYFGFTRPVKTVRDAVLFLGQREVMNIVLALSSVKAMPETHPAVFDSRKFWSTALLRASLARAFAMRLVHPKPEEVMTTALLADVGILVLVKYFAAQYRDVPPRTGAAGDFWRAERETFGCDHAKVGALLLERWRIPAALRHVVAQHHADGPTKLAPEEERLWRFVAGADGVIQAAWRPDTSLAVPHVARVLAWFNLEPDALVQTFQRCFDEVDALATVFGVGTAGALRDLPRSLTQVLAACASGSAPGEVATPAPSTADSGLFVRELQAAMTSARAGRYPLSVVLMEVEGIERVTERHGRETAEQILIGVMGRVQREVTDTDLFRRFGDSLFGVARPGAAAYRGAALAERLRAAVGSEPFQARGEIAALSLSLGGATWVPDATVSSDASSLLQLAATALREAKATGPGKPVWCPATG